MMTIMIRLSLIAFYCLGVSSAWISSAPAANSRPVFLARVGRPLASTSETATNDGGVAPAKEEVAEEEWDYAVPDDAVVVIKPAAMARLRELRTQQNKKSGDDAPLVLRMGVRSGGCSGMSYVMDVVDETTNLAAAQEDDAVDEYEADKIQCVVDAKSMLYLYGMELDYSTELIGGGFRFYNPNAEESCGCGSSFSV